jgi:hypothetical protein
LRWWLQQLRCLYCLCSLRCWHSLCSLCYLCSLRCWHCLCSLRCWHSLCSLCSLRCLGLCRSSGCFVGKRHQFKAKVQASDSQLERELTIDARIAHLNAHAVVFDRVVGVMLARNVLNPRLRDARSVSNRTAQAASITQSICAS